MQKIMNSLKLPALALAVICLIYGGLLISDLKNQTNILQKQNQNILKQTDNLFDQLNQIQSETNLVKNNNDLLAGKLAAAQKQIAFLQQTSQATPQQVLGASTNTIELKPAVITKTITREIEKNQVTLTIENIGSYQVDINNGDNAFDVLKRAAKENNFALDYDTYSFGVFVKSIGGIAPKGNQYWAFYFNGAFSNVGASAQTVQKDDTIFWQLASF